jgi:hypothetical protein
MGRGIIMWNGVRGSSLKMLKIPSWFIRGRLVPARSRIRDAKIYAKTQITSKWRAELKHRVASDAMEGLRAHTPTRPDLA